jgi:thioredoxin-like negative regulator of GroEL
MPRLAEKFEGQATIAKVNTSTEFVVAQQMGSFATPTVILFKDGQEVERLRGLHPPELYVEKLETLIDAE